MFFQDKTHRHSWRIASILTRLSIAGSSGVLREFRLISTGIPEELPKEYGRNMAGMPFFDRRILPGREKSGSKFLRVIMI